jgi:hypothetical protein
MKFSGGGYMPGILDYIEVLIQIFKKILVCYQGAQWKNIFFVRGIKPRNL